MYYDDDNIAEQTFLVLVINDKPHICRLHKHMLLYHTEGVEIGNIVSMRTNALIHLRFGFLRDKESR